AYGNRLAVDLVDARALDDHVDLLLARVDLVVLTAAHVGPELEPVDAERLHAELPADEANGTAGSFALDLLDVDHAVAHSRSFSRVLDDSNVRGSGDDGRGPGVRRHAASEQR